MRRALLAIGLLGLAGCAEFEAELELATTELVFADPGRVDRSAFPLVAEALPKVPPAAAVAAPADAGRLGTQPGLYGDRLMGDVEAAATRTTVLKALEILVGGSGVRIYASTGIDDSPLFKRTVALPPGTAQLAQLTEKVCLDAALFCYYSREFQALSVYDPAEYRGHAPVFITDPGQVAGNTNP